MINYIYTIIESSKSDTPEKDVRYCTECGYANPTENNFCENCGTKLAEPAMGDFEEINDEDVVEAAKSDQSPVSEKKPKKKKIVIILIIAVLVLAGAAVAVVKYMDSKTSAEYNAKVTEGDKYMKELDYEKAEASYLAAIEIEPKKSDTYVKAADVYIAQEDYTKAEKILEKGQKNAGGKKIKKKLQQVRPYGLYDDYLNDVLIPETGLADVDESKTVDAFNTGLVSAVIKDFNDDEIPDMLTVEYEETEYYGDFGRKIPVYTINLFTCKDHEVTILDSEEFTYSPQRLWAEKVNVFLREYENNNYLIIGSERLPSAGGEIETVIYKVSDVIEEECETLYESDIEWFKYEVDYEIASEYDPGDADKWNKQLADKAEQEGISAFEKALSRYGIAVERITREDQYHPIRYLVCDEEDESETDICFVQIGTYLSDTSIDLLAGANRYIEDYTDLRSRVR